ncbi:MAG: PqqD family protein [Prevotella sp.]|nr:PqqD family protein [Prevotella sp.]
MKIKKGFKLRNVCGEKIIIGEGIENIDFSKIISMNESSAYLWENIKDQEFTAETMAKLLTDEYEVDYDTALADAKTLAKQWKDAGIIND